MTRGSAMVCLVCLGACKTPNPGFLGEARGSSTGPSSTGSTSGPASGSSSTQGSSSTSSSSGSGSESEGHTSTGTTAAASASSSSGGSSTSGVDTTSTDGSSGSSQGSSSTGDPPPCTEEEKVTVYPDDDMDSWGDGALGVKVCPGQIPDGFILEGGDCNDNNAEISPMGVEHCDQLDNNCNGLKDEVSGMNQMCSGCKLLENLGHFYFLCTEKVPASGAGVLCAEKAVPPAKAYHAKLESEGEFSFLAPKVMMNGFDVSIGLRDTGGKDVMAEHRWVADEAALGPYGGTKGVAPWAPAQPDTTIEDWVVITANGGKWADRKGSDPFYYLCEAEPAP